MGRAYPKLHRQLRAAVPRHFATKWTPVDLSAAYDGGPGPAASDGPGGRGDQALRIEAVEERLVLFESFPFAVCRLGEALVMEQYDALEELRRGAESGDSSDDGSRERLGPRRFPASTWAVAGDGAGDGERPFHGLACYIAFGDDAPAPDSAARGGGFPHTATSNADDPYPCTNWCNAFFPVGRGAWRVRAGDRIEAAACCHVHLAEPFYDVRVAVRRRGLRGQEEVVYEEEFRIRYRDLLGRVDTARAFLRRGWGTGC